MVGASNTGLALCKKKTFNGKDYYYKATCPAEDTAAKRIMTIQLYKDVDCTAGKEIDKAKVTYTMDETTDNSGTANTGTPTCTPVKGADKLWFTGVYTSS